MWQMPDQLLVHGDALSGQKYPAGAGWELQSDYIVFQFLSELVTGYAYKAKLTPVLLSSQGIFEH